VSRRYQVFDSVRHEKVFSLMNAFDLVENQRVYLYAFPRKLFQDFPNARAQLRFQAAQMQERYSPSLLNVLSWGEEEGLFYFVEEHPKGESLARIFQERRRRHQPFSDREALGLCWLLCRTLEGIHPFTVHGFLHPLDIYLEPWPDGPLPFYPKLAHAGVRAMLRAVGMPLEGLKEEAVCYASPEFIAYRPLQKQVDVYGVGAILYALLTLRTPTGCFVRPSSVRPGLPKTVDKILLRALDEDPDERYPTPGSLSEALASLWAEGDHRQELEAAVLRLSAEDTRAGATEFGQATLGIPWRGLRGGEYRAAGVRDGGTLFSLFFSDKARNIYMVLLMLMNLGLFCQAAMEVGSRWGRDVPDLKAYGRWESKFSDLDGSWE
jgi:serine/threonine protein kinase